MKKKNIKNWAPVFTRMIEKDGLLRQARNDKKNNKNRGPTFFKILRSDLGFLILCERGSSVLETLFLSSASEAPPSERVSGTI